MQFGPLSSLVLRLSPAGRRLRSCRLPSIGQAEAAVLNDGAKASDHDGPFEFAWISRNLRTDHATYPLAGARLDVGRRRGIRHGRAPVIEYPHGHRTGQRELGAQQLVLEPV